MEKRSDYIRCSNCSTLVDAREHVSQTLEEIVKELEEQKKPAMPKSKHAFSHKHFNYGIEDAIELIKKRL